MRCTSLKALKTICSEAQGCKSESDYAIPTSYGKRSLTEVIVFILLRRDIVFHVFTLSEIRKTLRT